MTWIATAEECREMDRQAAEMGITIEALMHEAGRAVARCVLDDFPDARTVAVVCGKGNNGGDGLVAARLLAEHQKTVEVVIAASPEELNEHATRERQRLHEVGIEPRFAPEGEWQKGRISLKKADVIIDALLGTGLRGAPDGTVAKAIKAIENADRPVVAVDIPSGVECDSGQVPSEAVFADRTVTFGLPKPFLFQGEGMVRAGEWSVAPIGFPEKLLKQRRDARMVTLGEARHFMPRRSKLTNKHRQGSLLVVAGSRNMPGAAVLTALAALRGGAGLVTVASVPEVCAAVSHRLPEALLMPLPERNGAIAPGAIETIAERANQYAAAVVGPGLSQENKVGEFLEGLFRIENWKFCIDADALTWASKGVPLPVYRFDGSSVLTPHEGELARLLGCESAEVQADRFGSARAAREELHHTVLLKGAHTLVATLSEVRVNVTGNPGLAAAGTGDVLAGLIGSLLLRLEPYEAATLGAYWHGLAADLCAADIGPAGFLASEVADALPRARATILSSCSE